MRYRIVLLAALVALPASAIAQNCPKVTYTTVTPTLKSLVASVNCLVGSMDKAKPTTGRTENSKGFQVDSFQVIGPQHSRAYHKIIVALLSVPKGNEIKTALVSPDNPEASVEATAGAECKVKINADNTVDGQCNLTGGTLYIVYHN
jgi:hypothetical protein